jgi:hypothetical protein
MSAPPSDDALKPLADAIASDPVVIEVRRFRADEVSSVTLVSTHELELVEERTFDLDQLPRVFAMDAKEIGSAR